MRRALLQSEYNLLFTSQAEQLLLKSRHRFYEFGDKPGKALALQLRLQAVKSFIAQVQDPAGNVISDPQEINNQFKLFYSSLYQSDSLKDLNLINVFFENLEIPQICDESKAKLDNPISLSEILQAISQMQSGKSPGPDGFPVEFFKRFSSELSPWLLSVFEESFDNGSLPFSMRQALISLILKPNKDPLDCGSYRPISLLNVDVKILAKILAIRLESIVQSVIHIDQTGFIKNRQGFFNLRRLMNIIYTSSDSSIPEVLVSLDAEKAFDRIEWDYLFLTLKKFGFGDRFISWIKLLYSSPLASVKTNGINSEYFSLYRGTRQGCPLSPLLFAIAMEPLAIAFRSNQNIFGISRADKEQRISLYADDVVLYISDPEASLPNVLEILRQFSSISGYKLNLNKSELFLINPAARALSLSAFPFKLAPDQFRYLGINVTRKYIDLFKYNFVPILDRTKQDLARWTTPPLSVAGRINTIKMNILPKFLFLFQNIPVFIPKAFFKTLDGIFSDFIWNGGPARIQKLFLQQPKKLGGFAFPNILFYYWAVNIHSILYWSQSHYGLCQWVPAWVDSCSRVSLHSLVCSALSTKYTCYSSNPLVLHSLRIWKQFRKHFGFQAMSGMSPIYKNSSFLPSISDGTFALWFRRGIVNINDLFNEDTFVTFSYLSEKFRLPKTHFFKVLADS